MSSSDDYPSQAAPFSGDETGDVFSGKDVVWQSPTTTERIVDTQSGFLVVVRKVESQLALSVKRRLGTPPVSSIFLTPDESLKLSKILASALHQESRTHIQTKAQWSQEIEEWLNRFGRKSSSNNEQDGNYLMSQAGTHGFKLSNPSCAGVQGQARRFRLPPVLSFPRIKLVGSLTLLVLGIILSSVAFKTFYSLRDTNESTLHLVSDHDSLNGLKVDQFARAYVSDLLDFSPDTYRVSQIQAMSYMVPELLERYWKETNFPLSRKDLRALSNGQTMLITKVSQSEIDDKKKSVDIFAELVTQNSKITSPIHIRLTLGLNQDGKIGVLDHKDLTASK